MSQDPNDTAPRPRRRRGVRTPVAGPRGSSQARGGDVAMRMKEEKKDDSNYVHARHVSTSSQGPAVLEAQHMSLHGADAEDLQEVEDIMLAHVLHDSRVEAGVQVQDQEEVKTGYDVSMLHEKKDRFTGPADFEPVASELGALVSGVLFARAREIYGADDFCYISRGSAIGFPPCEGSFARRQEWPDYELIGNQLGKERIRFGDSSWRQVFERAISTLDSKLALQTKNGIMKRARYPRPCERQELPPWAIRELDQEMRRVNKGPDTLALIYKWANVIFGRDTVQVLVKALNSFEEAGKRPIPTEQEILEVKDAMWREELPRRLRASPTIVKCGPTVTNWGNTRW